MAASGHPQPGSDAWVLTLALLRFGTDTRAARALKGLAATPANDLLGALAEAAGIAPADRVRAILRAQQRAAEALRRAARARLSLLPWFHPDYPPLLREIPDPPVALWCAGEARMLGQPSVAIVGSRRAAPTGMHVARRLAQGLAESGLVIVSGLARGIDGAAHQGALDGGGRSVAVLGCGADIVYPREHGPLIDRLRKHGAVVSEFPPGTLPLPHHFPLRNRIISGLCQAVIVIEASARSGSLITARAALEQGRDVLAVPGTVASGQYSGCHALIKDGAGLVETVEDVLGALGWKGRPDAAGTGPGNHHEMSPLAAVMAVGEPYTVDELAARSGLSGPALLAELGTLEVGGVIGRAPGGGFVKFDKSAIGERDG